MGTAAGIVMVDGGDMMEAGKKKRLDAAIDPVGAVDQMRAHSPAVTSPSLLST